MCGLGGLTHLQQLELHLHSLAFNGQLAPLSSLVGLEHCSICLESDDSGPLSSIDLAAIFSLTNLTALHMSGKNTLDPDIMIPDAPGAPKLGDLVSFATSIWGACVCMMTSLNNCRS